MVKNKVHTPTAEPELAMIEISKLLLDPANPRLKNRDDGAAQIDLACEIVRHYDAISVARLIANNGFYKSSALLVYKQDSGHYIVAEGNRRLTAVLGLTKPVFREQYSQKAEWARLSESPRVQELTHLPVYVYDGPTSLRPIIAAEHLNRKLSWEPFQKAREIVNLVDVEGYDFDELSKLSGITKTELKRMYRDFKLCKSLIKLGLSESMLTSDFSKLGEVTREKALLEFTGVPPDKDVTPGPLRFDDSRLEHRIEIIELVFGDDSVTPDSRQIRDLAKVVSEEESLSHLRATRDLSESLEIFKLKKENNLESTSKLLAKALDQIDRIFAKVAKDKDDPLVAPQVRRAKEIARQISEL